MFVVTGQDVHFVLEDWCRSPGQCRPAKVVRLWSDTKPYTAQLVAFVDGSNDYINERNVAVWKTSIYHDAEGSNNSYHLPEECNNA